MEYCKKCDNLITPVRNERGKVEFICKSCNSKKNVKVKAVKVTQRIEKDPLDTIPVLEEKKLVRPTIKRTCEECGGKIAYWWMIQTRSSDEPETRFYQCTECGHTWREYS